jgi:hypothetical protein
MCPEGYVCANATADYSAYPCLPGYYCLPGTLAFTQYPVSASAA